MKVKTVIYVMIAQSVLFGLIIASEIYLGKTGRLISWIFLLLFITAYFVRYYEKNRKYLREQNEIELKNDTD